ncbi:hypothetical protein ACFQ40_01205 [Kroppenstedtia eburnea]|uniref:hypothetical protein n=1 Tax=Kroppenstedtia eburnea TaxID=714067 RepID=UPI003632EA9A
MSKRPGRAFIRLRHYKDPGINKQGKEKTRTTENRVRYITFRSRERDDIQHADLFSKETDQASIGKFLGKIKQDPALKHPKAWKCHELILSFRREDYDRYGVDYREMTRNVMAELERRKGMKLDWVASRHLKGHHPHVHVIVKATGKDADGKTRRLRFDIPKRNKEGIIPPDKPSDIKWMKEHIDKVNGRDHYLERWKAERESIRDLKELTRNVSRDLGRGLSDVARDGEKEQRRAQFNLFRQIRAKARKQQRQREGRYR